MTRGAAHLVCATLLSLDVGARTARLWLLLTALRCRVPATVAGAAIGLSDAAAAVTPMRLGGGPAQLATLVRAGVPLPRAASALGLEAITTYPAAAALGALLAARFGGAWWHAVAERVTRAGRVGPGLAAATAALVALALLVGWGASRLRHRLPSMPGLRAELALLAVLSPRVALGATALGAVHVAARVAVLPALAHALPQPPPLGVTWLGSFAMLYGQLVAPTPSGAGVVDWLGASGAAGALGAHALWVLGWWRAYTTVGGALAAVPALLVRRASVGRR